jgi:glycosyltransferase involved in cell wall biosynthesis
MARVTSVKNPMLAVEVARSLPHINFVMAGGGDLLDQIRVQAPTNLSVIGWADATQFWSSVSVALSTSDNEGMPIALIEAQLAGIPVIATDVGSNAEVIEDGVTGFVCQKDRDQLVAAVQKLAEDSGRRQKMGAAASERALQRFSPALMIENHASAYVALFSPTV